MQRRDHDAAASVPVYFGTELRRYRKAADLTQDELGEKISYTGALISMVEAAKRTPTRQFAEACDRVLCTGGALTRVWPLLHNYPSWFRGYVELEASATSIQTFEVQVVPGLLQTEEYARAVLRSGRHPDIGERVAARLDRQEILTRPEAPLLWIVIDESVLHRRKGSPEVMRAQLQRLADAATTANNVVQVLPYWADAPTDGSMILISFDGSPDVAYFEVVGGGTLITDADEVARCQRVYDLLRAAALSPDASLDMITKAMEGYQ